MEQRAVAPGHGPVISVACSGLKTLPHAFSQFLGPAGFCRSDIALLRILRCGFTDIEFTIASKSLHENHDGTFALFIWKNSS